MQARLREFDKEINKLAVKAILLQEAFWASLRYAKNCENNFMKFSFKPNCRISDNIRQIAAQQVLLARKHLTDPSGGDIHEGNHEARKCFKRLRDLLRMARPALGKKLYRREKIGSF